MGLGPGPCRCRAGKRRAASRAGPKGAPTPKYSTQKAGIGEARSRGRCTVNTDPRSRPAPVSRTSTAHARSPFVGPPVFSCRISRQCPGPAIPRPLPDAAGTSFAPGRGAGAGRVPVPANRRTCEEAECSGEVLFLHPHGAPWPPRRLSWPSWRSRRMPARSRTTPVVAKIIQLGKTDNQVMTLERLRQQPLRRPRDGHQRLHRRNPVGGVAVQAVGLRSRTGRGGRDAGRLQPRPVVRPHDEARREGAAVRDPVLHGGHQGPAARAAWSILKADPFSIPAARRAACRCRKRTWTRSGRPCRRRSRKSTRTRRRSRASGC